MGRPSQSPIWPFLLVVAFLFLLSVVAPREWRNIAREKPARTAVERAANPVRINRQSAPAAPRFEPRVQPTLADERPATEQSPHAIEAADACETEAPHADADEPLQKEPISDEPARALDVATPYNVLRPGNLVPLATRSAADDGTATIAVEEQALDEDDAVVTSDDADMRGPAEAVAEGPHWAMPTDLVRRFEALSCECQCTDWRWTRRSWSLS